MNKFKIELNDSIDFYDDCNECDTVEGLKIHTNKVLLNLLSKINRKTSFKETTSDEEAIWTSKEVCEILDISIRTLDQYCSNGEISYYKPKKKRMFKQSDVNEFLRKGKRNLR